ncbi:MAG: mechanosensitive ion channel family protein [Candidatus Eremiobacteraeota bacterium]|nr:mechanosensitive ion channel family protein [Candidatus Eremiobacteraeota bacterium]
MKAARHSLKKTFLFPDVAAFIANPLIVRPSFLDVVAGHLAITIVASIGAFLAWRLAVATIDRFFARRFISRLIPRVATFSSLAKSIAAVVVVAALALLLLNIWSVNVAPALWSAGIITAAFAFGAQATVRDILTGFYCLVEDQYDVGDRVEVTTPNGVVAGTVDAVSLRSTRIVDAQGRITTIPNGNIVFLTNASRLPNRTSISIPLQFHADVSAMQQRLVEIAADGAAALGVERNDVTVSIDGLAADGATFRIEFESPKADADTATARMRQYVVARLQAHGWLPKCATPPAVPA